MRGRRSRSLGVIAPLLRVSLRQRRVRESNFASGHYGTLISTYESRSTVATCHSSERFSVKMRRLGDIRDRAIVSRRKTIRGYWDALSSRMALLAGNRDRMWRMWNGFTSRSEYAIITISRQCMSAVMLRAGGTLRSGVKLSRDSSSLSHVRVWSAWYSALLLDHRAYKRRRCRVSWRMIIVRHLSARTGGLRERNQSRDFSIDSRPRVN